MDLVKKLPSALARNIESNNYKLLSIFSDSRTEIRDGLSKIDLWRDENNAEGKALDVIAEQYEQKRGSLTDEQLRYLIRVAKQKNVATGDINGVLASLCMIFKCTLQDLHLTDDGPAKVKILKLPLGVIANAGFSTRQALQIVKSVISIGVSVSSDNFEGTFAFSDTEEIEIDNNGGFSDDTQSFGGFFGATIGDDEGVLLPI